MTSDDVVQLRERTAPQGHPMPDLPAGAFGIASVQPAGGGPRLALLTAGRLLDLEHATRAVETVWPALQAPAPLGDGLLGLLGDWDASFRALSGLVELLHAVGLDDERVSRAEVVRPHRLRAPLRRPSKILCAAQNYPDHVEEMRAARATGFNAAPIDESRDFTGDRDGTRPYLFLKAPSSITGPADDITIPFGMSKIDWEVELAVVVGRAAKDVRAAHARRHIAGYMTANDVSCRDLLFRPDRERLRSDWLGGKSHDGFLPTGPVFVPRQFVPDHGDLRLRLSVNGQLKQDGSTRHLIYSCEEQIEYAARLTTLEPGDVLNTGTPGGVGQGSNSFLQPGDLVEAEVDGLGMLRNRFVAATQPTEEN